VHPEFEVHGGTVVGEGKAIHNATHPAARLRRKNTATDIAGAVLRLSTDDAGLSQTLAAEALEEDAEP
jgi:hypothetical protein